MNDEQNVQDPQVSNDAAPVAPTEGEAVTIEAAAPAAPSEEELDA